MAPLGDGTGFVFTRRSYELRRGAGQFALPGGNIEPDESPLDAALRELHEELGVKLDASTELAGSTISSRAAAMSSPRSSSGPRRRRCWCPVRSRSTPPG
ncbi:MAG: NUDIX domain-containing protein [Aliidongia sp.]